MATKLYLRSAIWPGVGQCVEALVEEDGGHRSGGASYGRALYGFSVEPTPTGLKFSAEGADGQVWHDQKWTVEEGLASFTDWLKG